jgi:hypothetical protein
LPEFPLQADALADLIEIPLADWPGNCHGVAEAVLKRAPVSGMRLVRGHYHGDISRKSIYREAPFGQHSWLELEDGRILDPTRWAMERPESPEIYLGLSDVYDEAGLEASAIRPPLFPGTKSGEQIVLEKLVPEKLGLIAAAMKMETPSDERTIHRVADRLCYLLKSPPEQLDDASGLYKTLAKAGLKAMIKIDIWNKVMEPERFTVSRGANLTYDLPDPEDFSEGRKLFMILSRYISVEERELSIEDELEEIGYTLNDLWEALNDLERHLKYEKDGSIEAIPKFYLESLAVIAGDILGRGFGTDIRIERYAHSIGLDRNALNDLLTRMGNKVSYDLSWY